MAKNIEAMQLRRDIDRAAKKWQRLDSTTPPKGGWIRHVREALEMSTYQLARFMRVNQSCVVQLEKSEAKGAIQIASLRRAAKALHCELVYALVSDDSLEGTIEHRRHRIAIADLMPVFMSGTRHVFGARDLVDSYARKIKSRRLWGGDVI